jgi:hypothetical protein
MDDRDKRFVVCADGFVRSCGGEGEEVVLFGVRRGRWVGVMGEGSFLGLQSPHLFRVYPCHGGTTHDVC